MPRADFGVSERVIDSLLELRMALRRDRDNDIEEAQTALARLDARIAAVETTLSLLGANKDNETA